ncbi:MAG: hypothetical protein NTV51_14560 [Verrucomicrobia bacterium]|nr:hypothetical protein [Verrucomicrobiota bacterium]
MNTTSARTRRCPECSGVGTQMYGMMGQAARRTCAKCHGVGRLTITPRLRLPDHSRLHFRETSLRLAVEELQKAVKWREISLKPCSEKVRQAARSIMRHAALNSRTCYAGGLIQAN